MPSAGADGTPDGSWACVAPAADGRTPCRPQPAAPGVPFPVCGYGCPTLTTVADGVAEVCVGGGCVDASSAAAAAAVAGDECVREGARCADGTRCQWAVDPHWRGVVGRCAPPRLPSAPRPTRPHARLPVLWRPSPAAAADPAAAAAAVAAARPPRPAVGSRGGLCAPTAGADASPCDAGLMCTEAGRVLDPLPDGTTPSGRCVAEADTCSAFGDVCDRARTCADGRTGEQCDTTGVCPSGVGVCRPPRSGDACVLSRVNRQCGDGVDGPTGVAACVPRPPGVPPPAGAPWEPPGVGPAGVPVADGVCAAAFGVGSPCVGFDAAAERYEGAAGGCPTGTAAGAAVTPGVAPLLCVSGVGVERTGAAADRAVVGDECLGNGAACGGDGSTCA